MVTSVLNPNAPMFVPLAYREVEDFSDEWWELVQSSPWFRDYWLQECFSDPQIDDDPNLRTADNYRKESRRLDLVALASLKWMKQQRAAEVPRIFEKPPKIVNVKAKPMPIQQPR